ncbi:MAG: MoxR family ATPase [Methylococcaceae bacterium]|jgi:MoxR-like ATPase|nr:MoxR family ATPase [Methylococcaceae bacterium]MDZ4156983.1 MoxR family ATPase [Methylococcales bacterium]MDP2392702.1 MoxR family ATPase [Methylococcaceae bacterium]MDP3018567.1 MoxR family ATPase [Methylococcaceae bacterium]MDP3391322.1 MoxR family ATPase [Methylococcaceae bacterium]
MSEQNNQQNTTQASLLRLKNYINKEIIGQDVLVERMLIGLLADGHILVEGAPGLAKTRAINVLSKGVQGDFHRVQFTPDLLPADLTGTEIYRPQQGTFEFQKGPLFHNLILADEINRSPAKVQAALLEAMAERQITVGQATYPLPALFMVMATQNPIEQEGTYPLPEAQLDRFLLHVKIDYPHAEHEKSILHLARSEARSQTKKSSEKFEPITQDILFAARNEVLDLYMADSLEDYLLQIILATRNPAAYGKDIGTWLQYGASPRASIALDRCARAKAWLAQRDFVSPEDIQDMAFDVLRHRLILSYEAEAEGITTDHVIKELIARVAVP